jgi:hypothetical protein
MWLLGTARGTPLSDSTINASSPDRNDRSMMTATKAEVERVVRAALFDNRIVHLQVSIPSPSDPFDEAEAAEYLKLPADSVEYFARRAGELAYVDLGRGRRTYLRRDLDAFLARRREPSIYEESRARSGTKGSRHG